MSRLRRSGGAPDTVGMNSARPRQAQGRRAGTSLRGECQCGSCCNAFPKRKLRRDVVIRGREEKIMAHSNGIRDSVLHAIGNTPVVRLRKVVSPSMAEVLVKLEYYNPTGSYKDRMALAMIEGAEACGELRPGMRVVEWTGGSTGSSLAMVCSIKGYHFTPISSDGFSKEKLQTMRLFGADLEIFPAEDGKLVPELYQRMKRRAEELAQQPGTFYTDQFNNADAIRAYMGIGAELAEQAGTTLAAFCGGVGTAGVDNGGSRAPEENRGKGAPLGPPASHLPAPHPPA